MKNNTPRWEGLESTKLTLKNISQFCQMFAKKKKKNITITIDNDLERSKVNIFKISIKNLQESCRLKIDPELIPEKNVLEGIKDDHIFMDYFHRRQGLLKRSLQKLTMSYFCLFLIASVAAGVSLMFYACLKRQGYLITLMHILWNVIRFFIFSFFLYGTAYGVLYDILSDLIAVMNMIFDQNIKSNFLHDCIFGTKSTLFLEDTIRSSVNDFFLNADLSNIDIKDFYDLICKKSPTDEEYIKVCNDLNYIIGNKTLGTFDCGFLKSDLNHLYKALDDASSESQKLSAISSCSAFFGAIAVYFYLLVIHHYNNELFFDSGKSIFTGFDGFGRGYKNKNRNNDPAYKKRKLRAEIELTSKNDEQNEYHDINKNEDD